MRLLLAATAASSLVTAAPALAAPVAAPIAASASEAVDPARLAAARKTVDYLFPLGTYARIMNGTMDKMMDSLMDSMMKMPLRDLAGLGGVDTSKLSSASMQEIMAIYDPVYRQRMQVSTHAMMAEMGTIMTQIEPDVRDGMAHAYAARFDTKQLGELNAFFATPTGRAYAADNYLIMMSPEVMSKVQALMPKLMQAMPAMMEKVKTATASLPPQRKYADLTAADKAKLAQILGISEDQLEKDQAAKAADK